jgi:AmiR/NasT family two-component response regulator
MASHALLRDLRELSIVVTHPRDRDGEELVRHLQRIGCQVQVLWPAPDALPERVDVAFWLFDQSIRSRLPWPPGEPPTALVAIVDYESPISLRAIVEANVKAVIGKPIRPFGILTNLVLARALHGYEKRLTAKVAKLEETLRSGRQVDKAKRILMSLKGLSEEAAYETIRRQAMQKRVSMGVIASSIIHANDVFASLPPGPDGARA